MSFKLTLSDIESVVHARLSSDKLLVFINDTDGDGRWVSIDLIAPQTLKSRLFQTFYWKELRQS